jgi:hypothetical protein
VRGQPLDLVDFGLKFVSDDDGAELPEAYSQAAKK